MSGRDDDMTTVDELDDEMDGEGATDEGQMDCTSIHQARPARGKMQRRCGRFWGVGCCPGP